MGDLFEGFRWREVAAVVVCMVFFVGLMVASMNDIRRRFEEMESRMRVLEVKMVAQECLNSPELCRAIQRGR